MGFFQFYQLILSILILMSKSTKSQNIYLDENRKLQGIVISIEPNVDQNEELIQSIKERFSDASKALFEATGHMGKNEYAVQFGNISIILPENWKLKKNYHTTQYCNNAQIKIDKHTTNDQPFVRQLKGCGKSGDFIRFPVSFFVTNSQLVGKDKNRKLHNSKIGSKSDIDGNVELIKSIKESFLEASKELSEVTGKIEINEFAEQFGNISMILAKIWKLKENYHTAQYCNRKKMKLSKSFFESNNQLKGKGKNIMTEFVKLRYGVYSERILKNRVYVFNGSQFISSACNQDIEIILPNGIEIEKCRERNEVCIHSIKPNQNHNYSVMFDPFTSSSKYFCNDADMPHNKYTKNEHNIKCNQASITSVILQHQDFKNVRNHKIKYEPPRFIIFETGNRKIVLVLDISASSAKIINVMKEAVQIFIRYIVDDNDEIGIVVFHDKASILANLTKMNKIGRQLLINEIGKIRCQGGTNIGHGLELAIEVLGGKLKSSERLSGMIILLSDGENTYDPEDDDIERGKSMSYEQVLKQVKKKLVMTNVISYNQSDDSLIGLAKATGGRFTHVSYDVTAQQLSLNFVNVQKVCPSGFTEQTEIKSQRIVYKGNKPIKFTNIEKYVGKDKNIEITIDAKYSNYEPILINSSGKKIFHKSKHISNKKYVYSFGLQDTLIGQLFIEFKKTESRYKRSINNLSVNQSKFSKLLEENEIISSPIDGLSETLVELLTENTTITATIDLSNYDLTEFGIFNIVLEIQLPNKIIKRKLMLDDGIGDDSIERDKIFTRCLFPNDLYIKGFYKLRGKIVMRNKFASEIIRKFVDFQSIFVKDVDKSSLQDRISPAQIKEPLIKIIDKDKRIIEVEMITVGDNSMDGEISKYQIRIRQLKNKIINKIIKAKSYEKVNFLLDLSQVKIIDKIIEISIRGVDDNGNIGQWSSNVAMILS